MGTYYFKGGSRYNQANPTAWAALMLNGYNDAYYGATGWQEINQDPGGGGIQDGDPYWLMGSSSGGAKEIEIGLWNSRRMLIQDTGIAFWDGDEWGPAGGDSFWVSGFTGCTGTGIIGADAYAYATRFYNAVYNDFADFWKAGPGTEKTPGICYSIKLDGLMKTNIRADKACMGICTDTYGMAVGVGQKNSIPLSIGGFILAHVDKEYDTGDLLVPNAKGILTLATKKEIYEHRCVAKYMFKETKIKVKGVWVNGRHWVKVL